MALFTKGSGKTNTRIPRNTAKNTPKWSRNDTAVPPGIVNMKGPKFANTKPGATSIKAAKGKTGAGRVGHRNDSPSYQGDPPAKVASRFNSNARGLLGIR